MKSGRCRRTCSGLGMLLMFSIVGIANAFAGTEQAIAFPVLIDSVSGDSNVNLMATEYRPDGDGPFQVVVISHGNSAALDYAKKRPYIDVSRIILIGQSGGGFGSLALASRKSPGGVGVVNFAGGRGSRGRNSVCDEDKLVATMARYASTTSIPMLWLYTANDQSFGPALAARMVESCRKAGVAIRYVALPAFGENGHGFFSDPKTIDVWLPMFDASIASYMSLGRPH
jgi:acetyl esterase/lipase